jgi:hypothetical protein
MSTNYKLTTASQKSGAATLSWLVTDASRTEGANATLASFLSSVSEGKTAAFTGLSAALMPYNVPSAIANAANTMSDTAFSAYLTPTTLSGAPKWIPVSVAQKNPANLREAINNVTAALGSLFTQASAAGTVPSGTPAGAAKSPSFNATGAAVTLALVLGLVWVQRRKKSSSE